MVCGDTKNGSIRDFSFNAMHEFTEHVLDGRDQFRRTVCLGHNGSRYDSILAPRTIRDEQGLDNDVCMLAQGNKIIEMTLRKRVIFPDTYVYMAVKLASLPETLRLDINLRKGEFRYLFNTP